MAKDIITVDGEDRVVREDTAKSYRGVIWALTVLAIVVIGAAILFFGFLGKSLFNDKPLETPATIEKTTRN